MSGTVRITSKIDATILHATANLGAGKKRASGPPTSVIMLVRLGNCR
jgi:hypothetical protein